jgi:hypothetical protein
MTDTLTPGYFDLVRTGAKLPVNPVTQRMKYIDAMSIDTQSMYSKTNWQCAWGSLGTPYATYQGNLAYDIAVGVGGNFALTELIPSTFPTLGLGEQYLDSYDSLTAEALAKARLQDVDLLTMMAEMEKTIKLVLGVKDRVLQRADKIAKKLHKLGATQQLVPRSATFAAVKTALVRKHRTAAKDAFLDVFTDSWMEDRYGWRILLYDIESLQELWLKMQADLGRIVRGVAETTAEWSETTNTAEAWTLNTPRMATSWTPVDLKVVKSNRAVRKVGVGYEYALQTFVTIDPVITALELIKFSFVADWFTNLGDIARAYSPFGSGSVAWYWGSTTVEFHRVLTGKSKRGYYSLGCPDVTSTMVSGSRIYQRVPLSWNDHRPEIRFYNKLDWLKVVDLFSLLRNLGSGFKPYVRT